MVDPNGVERNGKEVKVLEPNHALVQVGDGRDKVKLVPRNVDRSKHRKSDDVIVMSVGKEPVRFTLTATKRTTKQGLCHRKTAGSRIKEQLVFPNGNLNAGGVSANAALLYLFQYHQ